MSQRESGRLKEGQLRRVLDQAARKRRQRQALEALEEDNYQTDPHADLKMNKKAPKFEENNDANVSKSKKRKSKSDQFKLRVRKNFTTLLEEEQSVVGRENCNYLTASVPPSHRPDRKFCSVCGFPSAYTCMQCGCKYCCVRCLNTHQETRCLKWIAWSFNHFLQVDGLIFSNISYNHTLFSCIHNNQVDCLSASMMESDKGPYK